MNHRSLLPPLERALVAALLATLAAVLVAGLVVPAAHASAAASVPVVAPGAAGAAKAVKPSQDFPHMPPRCATRREKIPSKPTVCPLNRFKEARPTLVIWGDSHSWMFLPAVREAVQGRRVNLVAVMMGSCPPMDNQVQAEDAAPACFHSNRLGIDLARRLESSGQPYRILLAGSWQRYLHALKVRDRTSYVGQMALAMRQGTPRLARTLRSIGARVDVIGQVATVPTRRPKCARGNLPYACNLPRRASLPEASATRGWVARAFKPVLRGAGLIDVNRAFCNATICRGKVGVIRTWFDDLHLSATRSATLAPFFADTIDAISPVPEPEPEPEPEECDILGIPIPCP